MELGWLNNHFFYEDSHLSLGIGQYRKNFRNRPTSFGVEFCAIADFRGCKVEIACQGDPESLQATWLDELLAASCEVIVCAFRTKGQTVSAVDQRARTNGYVLIGLSPFSSDGPIRTETLNELTADAVIALIRKSLTY